MISAKKILLSMAAACMLLALPACNKNVDVTSVGENGAMTIDWRKENVNALLAFVPEDSPFVLASTRQVGLDQAVFQLLREQYGKNLDVFDKFMRRTVTPPYTNSEDLVEKLADRAPDERAYILSSVFLDPPSGESKREFLVNIDFIKQLKDFMTNFKDKAQEFGINPEHSDQIVYLDDSVLVFKQTVDDGLKLKSKMNTIFKNIPLISRLQYKEVKSDNVTWSVISFMPSDQHKLEMLKRKQADFSTEYDPDALDVDELWNLEIENYIDNLDPFVAKMRSSVINHEMKFWEEEILELESKKGQSDNNNEFPYNLRIAVHFGKNVVTGLLLTDESQLATYNRTLKAAPKPMNKSALGTIQSDTIALGFVDNIKGYDKLIKSDAIKSVKKLVGIEDEVACDEEIKSIIADYPRIAFNVRADGNNRVTTDSVLVFKDKDALKKIQGLQTKSLNLFTDKTLLGVSLNMDFGKLVDQILAQAETISKKEYKCSVLSGVASATKALPKVVENPEFGKIKTTLSGFSGINFAMDRLELIRKREINPDWFDFIFNATGPKFAEVAPDLIPTIGLVDRSLARQLERMVEHFFEGKELKVGADPIKVETNSDGDNLKLSVMLTQTDLIAATPKYDVKSVSTSERIDPHAFLDIVFAYKFYTKIYNYEKRDRDEDCGYSSECFMEKMIDDVNEIYKDTVYQLSIGANDEGIVSTLKMAIVKE